MKIYLKTMIMKEINKYLFEILANQFGNFAIKYILTTSYYLTTFLNYFRSYYKNHHYYRLKTDYKPITIN